MSATPVPTPQRPPPKRQRLDSLRNPQPRSSPGAHQIQQDQQVTMTLAKRCRNPSCRSVTFGEEEGNLVCQECGTVISEGNIVSEVQFAETSAGGHLQLGSYVGTDQAHAANGLVGLRHSGAGSRDITEATGKRYIQQIGAALIMPQVLLDSGFNVFKLAAANNFIQGRTTRSVAACSLYIACRLRKDENTHMLIDFADILQLNVFKLGHVYKNLLDDLRLNGSGYSVHPLNPETLIWRFASKIELGPQTTQVANDAVRIVQRMNRDWMTPGRRPAGICGAALLMAARMNNFRRTVREMVYTVKVTELTLMKRLAEFSKTGSGGLTVEEFRRIDLERSEDPPAFGAGKKKPGPKRKIIELDDDGDTDVESERATSAAPSTAKNPQLQTPANTQKQTSTSRQNMPPPPVPIDPQLTSNEPPTKKRRGRPQMKSTKTVSETQASGSTPATPATENFNDAGVRALVNPSTSLTQVSASAFTQALDSTTNPEDQQAPTPSRGPISMTEDISDSEFGPNDPELLNCLLTPTEHAIKHRIWTHENRDWIRAQNAKELQQRLAEANGTARQIKKRIRRRTRMGDMRAYRVGQTDENGEVLDEDGDSMPATGAADAVGKMLMKRGYSRKINYEAVNKVYEPSSSSSRGSESRRGSVSAVSESPGAGSASPAPVAVTSPGANSPVTMAVPGAGNPEKGPISMLASSSSSPPPRNGKSVAMQATSPNGPSRITRPSTPTAGVLAPQPPQLPQLPTADEEQDENDIANDAIPVPTISIDDDGDGDEDEDEDEDNPEDYYEEEDGDGSGGGESDIEDILEAARRGGEGEGDYED